jgi:putative transposase
MCARAERVFGTTTARDMYAWSHYTFMQRLYHKAQITPNKNVAFTREPGTSKTCDACGCVRENLGGAKVFRCYGCGYRAGRDVGHASRGNILAAIGAANNTPWDGVNRVAARGSVVQND